MRVSSTLFILFLVTPSMAHSAEFCEIRKSTEQFFSGRAFEIKFPDERVFTVVGHTHSRRTLPGELIKLAHSSIAELTNKEFLSRLESLKNQAEPALKDAASDYEILRQLQLTKSDNFYVGVESTERVTLSNLDTSKRILSRIKFIFENREIQMKPDVQLTLMAILGVPYFYHWQNPEYLLASQIVGVEGKGLGDAHRNFLNSEADAKASLYGLLENHQDLLNGIGRLSFYFDSIYKNYHPETDYKKTLQTISLAEVPNEFHEAMMLWVKAKLGELNSRKKRDHGAVRSMLKWNRSGVLFIGRGHRESIMGFLREACLSSFAEGSLSK